MTSSPYYGPPMFVGSRRSRTRLVAESRRRLLDQQADIFAKRSQMEEMFSRFESNPNIPAELMAVLKMQIEALMPHELPDIPPDEELIRNELEGLADSYSGAHFEETPKGYILRNFGQILMNASHIEKRTTDLGPGWGSTAVEFSVITPSIDYDFSGPTAVAFERYLYFSGLMTLETNKMPCPQCGEKEPQDCPECGGLGWILKPALEKTP